MRIGSAYSDTIPITHGVPQGAILSPLLFCVYLNDLPTAPTFYNLESYVDDSKLFMSFPLVELDAAIEKLEQDLHRVAVRTIYLSIPIKLNSFSSEPDRC